MTNLEKIDLIDKTKLNQLFYFTSLIDQAYSTGLLCDKEVEQIQLQSLSLLSNKITAYTKGRSSSVGAEVAQTIMQSNFYTIGVYLKSFEYGDDAVLALQSQPLSTLYNLGLRAINRKINVAKCYYTALLPTLLDTPNYAYHDTLTHGMAGFFKLYQPDFNACEMHITVDYPLCNPICNLTGIEFIQKYLQAIKAENEFCNCFAPHTVHQLMCGVHLEYSELMLNLFEQVLTNALGCALLHIDVSSLSISNYGVGQLRVLLKETTTEERNNLLAHAYHLLTQQFSLLSPSTQAYGRLALEKIAKTIESAIKTQNLNQVFITLN